MTDTLQTRAQQLISLDDQIAARLTSLIGLGRPRRFSKMQRTGTAKYLDQKGDLTHEMLIAHAAGRATYAATLDRDGKARAGVIEIDKGGRVAVLATLAAAHELGIHAIGIAIKGKEHDGGHVWVFYDDWYPVADILALLRRICAKAGLPSNTELWPRDKVNNQGSDQGIRLLFGYHVREETRGDLLLQTGEVYHLDTELLDGFAAVQALSLNGAPPAILKKVQDSTPSAQKPQIERKISPGELGAERMVNLAGQHGAGFLPLDELKSCYKEARKYIIDHHDLLFELEDWGADKTHGGSTCPCGADHGPGTKIAIAPGGKAGYNHSSNPACKLPRKAGIDVTNVLMTRYNLSWDACARRFAPQCFPPPKPKAEPREMPEYLVRRDRSAEYTRRKEQRLAENRRDLAALQEYAATLDMPDRAHLLAACLFDRSDGTALQVRPTNDQITTATGMNERRIQRAFDDLELAGLGKRTGGRNIGKVNEAATWTWFRKPTPFPRVTVTHEPEEYYVNTVTLHDLSTDSIPLPELTYERAPSSPPERACEAGYWEALLADAPRDDWRDPPFDLEENVNEQQVAGTDEADHRRDGGSRADARTFVQPAAAEQRHDGDAAGCAGPVGQEVAPEAPEAEPEPVTLNYTLQPQSTVNWSLVNVILAAEPADVMAVFVAASTETFDAHDFADVDQAEIDRMVKDIQIVAASRSSERHEPQAYWERHEAQTWRESHPVAQAPPAAEQKRQEGEDRNRARKRVKWDALGDDPRALGRERAILRNYLKSHPSAMWPRWQIQELSDRLAALTPADAPPAGGSGTGRGDAPPLTSSSGYGGATG